MKEIKWKATLNSIIYNHKYSTVEFNIKDIENLVTYIVKLETERDKAILAKTVLKNELDIVKNKLSIIQFRIIDNASNFIQYA